VGHAREDIAERVVVTWDAGLRRRRRQVRCEKVQWEWQTAGKADDVYVPLPAPPPCVPARAGAGPRHLIVIKVECTTAERVSRVIGVRAKGATNLPRLA
jgi:hypothetical protein